MIEAQHTQQAQRWQGAHLYTLRLLWAIVAFTAVVSTVWGIPARVVELEIASFATTALDKLVRLGAELLLAAVFFGAAGVVAWHAAGRPLGLLLAITLVSFGAVEAGMSNSLITPRLSDVWWLWHWPVLLLRWISLVGALLLLYTFPDGRFVPRWTLLLAVAWTTLVTAWLVLPDLPFNAIYGPTWRATPLASFVVSFAWLGTGIAAQVVRYRRASDWVERQQIKWWALGCGAAFAGALWYYTLWVVQTLHPALVPDWVYWTLRPAGQAALMVLMPIALAVAIVRYQLLDIDLVLNRALVYTTLTACIIGLYLCVVAGVGLLLGEGSNALAQLLGTCIVALLAHPLRARLQRAVNRLLYGERDEPYRVLSNLNRQLEGALSAEAALPTIVETVAHALKLPYVAIALFDGGRGATRTIECGVRPGRRGARVTLPLVYQSVTIGELRLMLRVGEQTLPAADRRLLEDLAVQVGIMAHDAQVSADLRHARQRLVAAREEERRRIRRDLHDGLGPALAGLGLRIDAARNLLRRDLTQTETLLSDASEQIHHTIADVRRLVYALRPPALDETGLVAALRQEFDAHARGPTKLDFDVPTALPPLPAAVEVAAYRIVLEAATNVLRHAQATTCTLRLCVVDGQLVVEVIDDGVGFTHGQRAGVGLRAMRERAAELGGACQIGPSKPRGTMVRAQLPLHWPAAEPLHADRIAVEV
jgi:signal transduction histidine kinase